MFIYKLFVVLVAVSVCIGCSGFPGNVSYHDLITKNGDIKVQNLEEIWKDIGYEKSIAWNDQSNFFELTDIEKNMQPSSIYKITIPIFLTTTKQPYGIRIGISLCSNGYPADYEEFEKLSLRINSLSGGEPTFKDKHMSTKVLIATTPLQLVKKGIIDENNQTKGDICFYPSLNILYNTMEDGDTVRITADEMDKAISEYEVAK